MYNHLVLPSANIDILRPHVNNNRPYPGKALTHISFQMIVQSPLNKMTLVNPT